MAIIGLATLLSFMLFCAMRNSDLRLDDTFIGMCECLVLRSLKYGWLFGTTILIYYAVH